MKKKGGMGVDERERIRRRKEALLNSRRRRQGVRQENNESKTFFLFRTYVTIMIVGIGIMLSFVKTEYTQQLTLNMKRAIAYQMPVEKIKQTGVKAAVWLEKADLSVLKSKEELKKKKLDKNKEPEKENTTETVQEFQPDLPEDEELP